MKATKRQKKTSGDIKPFRPDIPKCRFLPPLRQEQVKKHQNHLQQAQEKCSLSQADVLGLGRGAHLFHFEDQVPKFQIHPQLGNSWEGTVCGTRADIQTASLTVDSTLPML